MKERLEDALRRVGAVLLRQKKHRVYRLPNGQKVTTAKSMSDSRRGEKNALTNVYRAAGIDSPKPRKSEAAKKEKPGREKPAWDLPVNTMRSALLSSPVIAERLEQRVKELEAREAMALERAERWRMDAGIALENFLAVERDLAKLNAHWWVRLGMFLRVIGAQS